MCREVAVPESAAKLTDIRQVQMWVCDLVISRNFINRQLKVENYGMGNIVEQKSFSFAIRIVNVYKHLCAEKKEFVLSKQVLRSGTSIGANIAEAQQAQSRADFLSKLNIALKEATETKYWLRLLAETEYLSKQESESLLKDCIEIEKILSSIVKAMKK